MLEGPSRSLLSVPLPNRQSPCSASQRDSGDCLSPSQGGVAISVISFTLPLLPLLKSSGERQGKQERLGLLGHDLLLSQPESLGPRSQEPSLAPLRKKFYGLRWGASETHSASEEPKKSSIRWAEMVLLGLSVM